MDNRHVRITEVRISDFRLYYIHCCQVNCGQFQIDREITNIKHIPSGSVTIVSPGFFCTASITFTPTTVREICDNVLITEVDLQGRSKPFRGSVAKVLWP